MSNQHSTIATLLVEIGKTGIELRAHGNRPSDLLYRFRSPGAGLATRPERLAERMEAHRADLWHMLASSPPLEDDAEVVFIERLSMADELEMKTQPGSPAWLIALGEALKHCCNNGTILVSSA